MEQGHDFLIEGATRKHLREIFFKCLIKEHEDGGAFTVNDTGTHVLLTISNMSGVTKVAQEQVIFNGNSASFSHIIFFIFTLALVGVSLFVSLSFCGAFSLSFFSFPFLR